MKKIILALVLPIFFCSMATAQITYEDFEGGSGLTWDGLSGTYNGTVANPDPNAINMSATCASFTKDAAETFSLMIADLGTAMDLSTNNQFTISVYSPVATQILLKLEGTGGAIEATRNIANPNVWQDYTFDLSAASTNTGLEKIAIFFNPGQADDGDTYLVDNIRANPAGPCAGTIAEPFLVDDFECQRNATYGAGWDIITSVTNPDPSGINTSSNVGQYEDPPGLWSALVIDYNNPIDLSTNNSVTAKIWAPVAGQLLFKLEGGVSPPAEVFVDVTDLNTWVEYSVDFSSEAAAEHKKLVIFFNAGVEPTPGDTYYIDDINFAPAPLIPSLEDFENGANLSWEPLNGDASNHGTFDGVMANTDQSGINDSPNIGRYTKGNAAFSTLSAFLPTGLDLTANPQLNLQVNAPAGSATVTMQLVSPLQGNKDVTRDITVTGEWIQLEFNFEDFEDITDFERVNLLFDPGTAAPGTSYRYDNLAQGGSTVDACEGVVAIPNIHDDFECQRNVTYGVGADRLTVIDNPFVVPANPSIGVGEYKDPLGEWDALAFETGASLDLSLLNQFHMKIYSTLAVPILFKLEGGTSPAAEVWTDVTTTDEWVEYVVDFSNQAGEDHTRIVVFFNGGVLPTAEDLYYIDDALWTRAPYVGCIADMESEASSLTEWPTFAAGSSAASVVPNPSPDAINNSATCLQFIEAADADEPWAGFFTSLGNYINFTGDKTIRLKVLMPAISDITFKLEASQTGAPQTGDVTLVNTTTGVWEEMVFDYSFTDDNAQYQQLTMIPNILEIPTSNLVYYIDDISIADSDCSLIDGVFDVPDVKQFSFFPNPVQDLLTIENTLDVDRIEIFNLIGQKVRTIKLIGTESLQVQVDELGKGMYLLVGYNQQAQIIANAKFIKE